MLNVLSNRLIQASALWLVDRWATGTASTLRLFRNDIDPTPATVAGDLLEANYAGYAPFPLVGFLSAPTLVQDGEYESTTAVITWVPPAVGAGNRIYGLYVTKDGFLEAIQRFDEPIDVFPGSAPFRTRFNPHVKSGSLFVVQPI